MSLLIEKQKQRATCAVVVTSGVQAAASAITVFQEESELEWVMIAATPAE